MTIKASQVKELREKTGVGMMECKKALVENGGDLEKAILWLRERGMSRAAKKAGRVAAEGICSVLVNAERTAGVILEVNCETDFSAKNADFQSFVNIATQVALENEVQSIEQLAETKMEDSTVGQKLTDLIAKVGENMNIRRVSVLKAEANGLISGYSHMGGKIGTLVRLNGASNEEVATLGQDVAMHVAAAAPRYLNRDSVDASELAQEQELAKKKLIEEGKPEDIIEKIMVGQINKFYSEVCLVDQPFVKEPKLSVSKHIQQSKLGVELTGFVRYQLGEGIEKKSENFAEEVAAQLNK
ncbi:MAG: translation elongation factor Ts [Bdellovibrionota bacterium]